MLRPVLLLAALLAVAVPAGASPPKTVCTMTVNSADEAEAFRRALPADRYRFVELVEKGRSDWLEAACRRGVECDLLVISGHHDGEGMFFSDEVERAEHLPVRELERVACSASCPGLFARLAQVYLFGCHTLAPGPLTGAGSVALAPDDAPALAARHGESSRDRMTRIFAGVPVVYGFPGVAPLGPVAGDALTRWLRDGGVAEVAVPRPSARLLARFAEHGMTATRGIGERDPRRADQRDVCGFEDQRMAVGERAAFVHALLARGPAEARIYLAPLERFAAQLLPDERRLPPVAAIAEDDTLRERMLAHLRSLRDDAVLRARWIGLAHDLGWLDAEGRRAEWADLFAARLAHAPRAADVDLACRLGREGALEPLVPRLRQADGPPLARAAVLACAGDDEARAALLGAIGDGREHAVEYAAVLLQHRPVDDAGEYRALVREALAMSGPPDVQARALEALAAQPALDTGAAADLASRFPAARSLAVQRAIAGLLLRAGYRGTDAGELARMLAQHRLPSTGGRDVIDVLIRRLNATVAAG